MKNLIYSLIVLLLFVGIGACGMVDFFDSGEGYFYSSNEEYMAALKKELDKQKFAYKVDDKGYIRFSPEDQVRFYGIKKSIIGGSAFKINSSWLDTFDGSDELNKLLKFSKGFKLENDKFMELLKQELDAAGVEYILDKKGFVRYSSKDESRFDEAQALVTAMVSGKRGMGPAAGDIGHDFLKALKGELDSAGIGHSIDDEGTVRFVSGDRQVFKSVLLKLHKMHHLGDAARILKEEKRKRLIHLLEEKKVEHLILTNSHGIWVRWYPENKAQQDEIWSVVTSLGCGGPSMGRRNSHGVTPLNENSQVTSVQQMCSTLPEKQPCSENRKKKKADTKASGQTAPSKMALKQGGTQSCAS